MDTQKEFQLEDPTQKYFSLCNAAMSRNIGETVTSDNQGHFISILVALADVYGVDKAKLTGDPDGETELDRRGLAKGYLWAWKEDKFDTLSVLRALQKVPSTFMRYPTEGMVRALIRGQPLNGYQAGWVHPDAGGARPEDDDDA